MIKTIATAPGQPEKHVEMTADEVAQIKISQDNLIKKQAETDRISEPAILEKLDPAIIIQAIALKINLTIGDIEKVTR